MTDEEKIEPEHEPEPVMVTEPMVRNMITGMFRRYSRVKHQIDTMDQFMLHMVPNIVEENNLTVIKSKKFKRCHVIKFGRVTMHKPTIRTATNTVEPIKPHECRKRGLTYSSDVYVDVTHEIYDNSQVDLHEDNELRVAGEVIILGQVNYGKLLSSRTYREVLLCDLPVMVQGAMCHLRDDSDPVKNDEDMYDPGGYFIINGNEKTVINQVALRTNFPFVCKEKRNQRYAYTCDFRSLHEKNIRSTSTLYIRITRVKPTKLPQILVTVPFIKYAIPVCAIFRLIGVDSPQEMYDYIMSQNTYPEMEYLVYAVLRDRAKDGYMDCSIDDLCDKIGKKGTQEATRDKRLRYVKHIFFKEFLPHMGSGRTPEIRKAKAIVLGYAILKLLLVYKGVLKEDDRDHLANRRVLTPGMLCGLQFRQQWRMFLKALNILVHRAVESGKFFNINDMISSKRITSGFKYALSTGNWGQSKGASTMKGVAQMLTRMTPLAALSHLRRINNPLNREGKAPEPRQLPPSHLMLICLTGDTLITLDDGFTTCPIKDILGKCVTTVNPETLQDSVSSIRNFFSIMPEKLLKITLVTGHTVKATPDHPFLVHDEKTGKPTWVKTGELTKDHRVYIRHMPVLASRDGFKPLFVDPKSVDPQYVQELSTMGLVGRNLSHKMTTVLARLMGAAWTDGSCRRNKAGFLEVDFNLGETADVHDMHTDILFVGFMASISESITDFRKNGREVKYHTWKVVKNGAFAALLHALGLPIGKRSTQKVPLIPDWIFNNSLSVQQQFLSGFQGGDGCTMSFNTNGKAKGYHINMGSTAWSIAPEYLESAMATMTQISNMFAKAGIASTLSHRGQRPIEGAEKRIQVHLRISTEKANMIRYANYIYYAYCYHKQRRSAACIAFLQYWNAQKEAMSKTFNAARKEYAVTGGYASVGRRHGLSAGQVERLIKYPNREPHIYGADPFEFSKQCAGDSDKVHVPVAKIEEIPPEEVYDFETASTDHSFVANGVISSNCSVETPEGSPCGLITNMAMSTHIRIGASSEKVIDLLQSLNLIQPLLQCTQDEIRLACKVIVNGIWIGTTSQPAELHRLVRLARQYQDIPYDTSAAYIKRPNCHQLIISTDSGAFLHPVLVQEKLHLVPKLYQQYKHNPKVFWDVLMTEGCIEFLEKEEEETYRVAMRLHDVKPTEPSIMPYSHVQIHPSLMFGVCASLIPFPHHNQAPRNMYQCVDADEPIRMADGSRKRLGDVKVGDEIVTFDPKTLEQFSTTVTHVFEQLTDKPMVEVTAGGHRIKVTDDHLFMTDKGWLAPKNFVRNTKLALSHDYGPWFVFTPVQSVIPIDSILIADITTKSESHCFITASGFGLHNSSMGKQAIGPPATNYQTRPETKMQVLSYPQRPIVSTFAASLLGQDSLPPMCNVRVGIGVYTGYNQEDSVIGNKASFDRGLFRSTAFQSFKDCEKAGGTTDRDVFEKPDPSKTLGMQHANYNTLNPVDGLVDVNVKVTDSDALIGKVMVSGSSQKKNKTETTVRERCTLWRSIEDGVVDQVMLSSNVMKSDLRTTRVRVRSERIPEIGDKLSSRHGQVWGLQYSSVI